MIWEWIGIVSNWSDSYTTWCIVQRLFAIINLMHCLSWYQQIEGLMGDEGIDPIKVQLQNHQRTAEKIFFDADEDKNEIVKKRKKFAFLKFRFLRFPTLFWLSTSPFFLKFVLALGIISSLLLLFGLQYLVQIPIAIVILWWTNCLVNSSITQVAEVFALQTESMMTEATFLFGLCATLSLPILTPLLSLIFTQFIFIQPMTNAENEAIADQQIAAEWTKQFGQFIGHFPNVPIALLRWLCFRIMMSAGLVKWFGSPHWRQLSAMSIHYLTQPLLNPLSRYFYSLPAKMHSMETLLSLIIEGILPPIAILLPFSITRYFCGVCFVGLMVMINVSGTYAYLGFLTSVISLSNFDDHFFHFFIFPEFSSDFLPVYVAAQSPSLFHLSLFSLPVLIALTSLLVGSLIVCVYLPLTVFALSYAAKSSHLLPRKLKKLFVDIQHTSLVHVIGFFATMTTYRWEIILEGSYDGEEWKRYDFPYKISHPNQTPTWSKICYWPRLDWMLWFVPLRVRPFLSHVDPPVIYPPWIDRLTNQLLRQNRNVLKLVKQPTFDVNGDRRPPRHIRVSLYDYRFALTNEAARALEAENALAEITSVIMGKNVEGVRTSHLVKLRSMPKEINEEVVKGKLRALRQTIGEWFIETGPVVVLSQHSLNKDD